jgi:hypothetical protein
MATLQIENLPDELYHRIQHLATEKKYTINEAIIYLLQESFQSYNPTLISEPPTKNTAEILQKIRSRPRVNPMDFGMVDSTLLIQEDRNR